RGTGRGLATPPRDRAAAHRPTGPGPGGAEPLVRAALPRRLRRGGRTGGGNGGPVQPNGAADAAGLARPAEGAAHPFRPEGRAGQGRGPEKEGRGTNAKDRADEKGAFQLFVFRREIPLQTPLTEGV